MDKVKEIKSRLETSILAQFDNGIENVDCDEMYKAIDMIKDLAETEYHCAIVKAMEENGEIGETRRRTVPEQYRDFGKMFYTETDIRDAWKGKSGEMRKLYLESKESGIDRMQHLENYTKALFDDVMEMLQGATDNERQMLRTKMQTLAQKI